MFLKFIVFLVKGLQLTTATNNRMIESVLIFVVVVLVVYYFMKENRTKEIARAIPGPQGYPIIGNALMFLGKPADVVKRLYSLSQEYKEIVAIWLGPRLVVGVFDPRDVEVIFRDRRAMAKSDEYQFVKAWLGDSILLSSGTKFRINKKIMMPAFYTSGLKNHIELFNIHARRLVDSLRCEVGKEEFDIQNYLFYTMLSELLETTLGVSHDTLDDESIIEYGRANSQLCKISHIRTYKFWLRFDSIFRWSSLSRQQTEAISIVHPLCERVISRRKAEMDAGRLNVANHETGEYAPGSTTLESSVGKSRNAVLVDLLLNSTKPDGTHLTQEEIKDEILTVMFAGQDTTSVTIGFALSLLGLYQYEQDKAYAELYEIFGDSDRIATYEDLQKMEYLERVMQETWRLYPPVPAIGRKPTADIPMVSTNCIVPKGCTVAIITALIHRNPKHFENPHKFNPDNFLPERVKVRHPYSFIPFSGGIRTCIGAKYANLNIKVLLSTLLRNYKIIAKRSEKEFKLVAETTLKRKEGFLISLEPRTNAPLLPQNNNESENITQDDAKVIPTDINLNQYRRSVSFAA